VLYCIYKQRIERKTEASDLRGWMGKYTLKSLPMIQIKERRKYGSTIYRSV
jgi:hypothetical protein